MKLKSEISDTNPSILPLSGEVKFIPYNKKLVSRARELRRDTTEAETILWEKVLKDKKLLGLKFTRQKPLGSFIVDFYCAKLQLAIEVDGKIHHFQKSRDRERDNWLREKFGIKIIRYKNIDIMRDVQSIVKNLSSRIQTP